MGKNDNKNMSFDIGQNPLLYDGPFESVPWNKDQILTFNLRHQSVMNFYGLELALASTSVIARKINGRSNLGVFASKKMSEATVLASALPAAAVALGGLGAYRKAAPENQTKSFLSRIKRQNDRTAGQVMSEVLQLTAQDLEVGQEILIKSTIAEGMRAKPGEEEGGNPTIPVGALFGKEHHQIGYGRGLGPEVTLLSMGADVIEGTTKSAKGLHSSLTTLFITESGFKRHLPDIYVERWMAGADFPEFNPRDISAKEGIEIIANALGKKTSELCAFFLDRSRHIPIIQELNSLGVVTPMDKDGDLFPAAVMGLPGLKLSGSSRGLDCMAGDIGGSAEWAVGVLPLIWRGGQCIGQFTSHHNLTRKDLSPNELWANRYNFTERELMMIQDARFEQKPFFTIKDIMERPFAGGYCAFSGVTDNHWFRQLEGVRTDQDLNHITTNTISINSLGIIQHWSLTFRCPKGQAETTSNMRSPKFDLRKKEAGEIAKLVKSMAKKDKDRFRLKHFFINEYYPAIIHTSGKMIVLFETINALIERKALSEHDRYIVDAVIKVFPEWFTHL